jgi:zinc metalloprotease ZmpB
MPFELTDNVQVNRDEQGMVQHLEHFQQPFVAVNTETLAAAAADANVPFVSAATPQALAEQYLREVAPIYGIDQAMLPDQGGADALTGDDTGAGRAAGSKLVLTQEKEVMGTTTISYQQTYEGLPVWEAGVSVTILPAPMRVTASQSSIHQDVSLPSEDALESSSTYEPEAIKPEKLKQLLRLSKGKPTINGTPRELIYRFSPNQRLDPEAQTAPTETLQGGPPTLPLPPVPDTIAPGQHYVVTEVLFTLPVEGYGPVNWRAFVEVNTGAVLYLRAFIACATGMIFRSDPSTAVGGAAPTPTAGAAILNPFRSTVPLDGLANGNPQVLSGHFVQLVDNAPPAIVPPTQVNPPANFFYDAPTREFAAVNAYHHCDWLFRHMEGMGFNIASYFNGTAFPVPVDPCAFSDAVNARAPGNIGGIGSGGFQFGLAGNPFPAVSIAADVRVVLHEFGHALLWDSVHSPNFGFAHSAGDSLAAILLDPESALRTDPVRRFETFPWIIPNRNHGRDVATGWGWGGVNDVGSYSSEQILSTTHFRLYRSLGGDSDNVNRRKLAARQTVYLIFRAIGSLATNPVTPTPIPNVFATALMNADIGTINFEGHRGGAFHKVIRWSFEKQGLYQPAGAPRPVTTPGASPDIDVYINDGRNGEYPFQPVHWECTDIWNRLARSAGGGGGVHQTPVVGRTNFAYVRVKNRGTQHANNVVVRGYSANPGVGLSWPGDWTPMNTPQITVAGGIPPGGSVVVGPFRWKPRSVGHECMFMEVSATGDLSNIDAGTFFPCAAGPTPEWRLVPFDNNLGQRNVAPVPGGGGIRGLLSAFLNRRFLVRNPFEQQVRMEVKAKLPPFLAERGWGIHLDQKENDLSFGLASGNAKEVIVTLRPGEEFSREQLLQVQGGVAIRIYIYADDLLIGGMTYQLDPKLKRAPIEKKGDNLISLNDPAIEEAIREARQLEEEAEMALVVSIASPTEAMGVEVWGDAGEEAEDALSEEASEVDDGAAAARQLLLQLGVSKETITRVNRVKLRKITVEIELGDA